MRFSKRVGDGLGHQSNARTKDPDPAAAGHAILLPRYPSTISLVMESISVSSTRRINKLRREAGLLWPGRFFDRALRTVSEYHEKVEYIHLNPVKRGPAQKPEDWKWSSIHDYTGTVRQPTGTSNVLLVDRILLPADERARI